MSVRPLQRVGEGHWRTRDGRYEFIGGRRYRSISAHGDAWHVYATDDTEPVYFDRDATLAEAVERVERDFYRAALL